jgi:cell cycle sensor histidine kinase DivJ
MATADLRAFKQIILNLLSNAVKFTPPAGSVIIRLAAVGDALELVVADTGIGIAPEDLKRLGRPFEQAGGARDRARGSGLGLALVAALARLHGGELTLESRLGDGTAATVRLPVLSEGASAPLDAAAPAGAAGGVSLTAARGAPPLEPELDDARSQTVSPNGASANIRETTAEWKRLERPSAKIVRLPPIRLPPPPPRSEG